MAEHSIIRKLVSLVTKHEIISIGTKYFPTTPLETEYVDMFNYTQTMLMEIDKAHITTESIFTNLVRDVGRENIPENHSFYELLPAQDKVEEYALVSNIIMGSDRYMYVELSEPSYIINLFTDIILRENGEIIERSETEIVSRLMSKNDAIRVAIRLVGIGLDNGIKVRAAAGMTGAAAIERSIKFNKEVGDSPGVAFTKLGGEYALVLDTPFKLAESEPPEFQQYLFIDIVDSTNFISKHGRNKLVELMTSVKEFMEDCEGQIEGYREGGDDLIAKFPSKDVAIRAGLRREAGERANIAESIHGFGALSLVIFDLANGLYGYYIPSDFTRTLCEFLTNKKGKLITAFIVMFVASYLLAIMGMGIYGLLLVLLLVAYYTFR